MAVPYHEASIYPSPPAPSKWGPYSGASDFTSNMIVILIIILCAILLALALNAFVRYLLCANRRRRGPHPSPDPEKPSLDKAAGPPVDTAADKIFAAGAKLAGKEEAECAICLLEFADGDRVRVLPACGHGFHVGCIETWLRNRSSCPTCRSVCRVAVGPAAASGVTSTTATRA